jgi:RNA-directed DNA polymerase
MLVSKIREHVQTSLQGIAEKAKRDREYRFRGMYREINRYSLMDAWYDLNKSAATGVDRLTASKYKGNLAKKSVTTGNAA